MKSQSSLWITYLFQECSVCSGDVEYFQFCIIMASHLGTQSSFTAVKQSEKKNTVSSRALMWWTLGQGGKLRHNSGWSSEKQQ